MIQELQLSAMDRPLLEKLSIRLERFLIEED